MGGVLECRVCERYRNVPALSKKDPLDAAMFMIQEIGVAPVPGDGFYQEGKFGDECVFRLEPSSSQLLALFRCLS